MRHSHCQEICEVFSSFKISGYNSRVLNYLYKEVFRHRIYHFETETRKPLIVDCGSNIGMSIMYFKTIFPNSEIIAFEANPFAFRLLEKNIIANGLKDIVLHNVALSDDEAELFLNIGDNNIATPLAETTKERISLSCVKLSAQRLSNFIKHVRAIDLIKLDVEGAEIHIVDDLIESGLIRKSAQYIVELHRKDNRDNDINFVKVCEKFKSHGFSCETRANPTGHKDSLLNFYRQPGELLRGGAYG